MRRIPLPLLACIIGSVMSASLSQAGGAEETNSTVKSQAMRALEGAADARVTLEAGFTTVRDVENEGSGYADVALRDAIDQGLVDGPRMEVATRGLTTIEASRAPFDYLVLSEVDKIR